MPKSQGSLMDLWVLAKMHSSEVDPKLVTKIPGDLHICISLDDRFTVDAP